MSVSSVSGTSSTYQLYLQQLQQQQQSAGVTPHHHHHHGGGGEKVDPTQQAVTQPGTTGSTGSSGSPASSTSAAAATLSGALDGGSDASSLLNILA
jgi:hypothetical protein